MSRREILPPGIFGQNRTMVTPHYAVMPPEGILESRLPGLERTKVHFQTSPAMGANFAQALLVMQQGGGTTAPIEDGLEHFLYVLAGEVDCEADGAQRRLGAGGFAYVQGGRRYGFRALGGEARAIWIKRPYLAAPGITPRASFFGSRDAVPRVNKHTQGRNWQALLGEADLAMDMEVNILSFAPGTYFPFVETHIMQHGLYMLEGQGLYLLGREWHECWAGDFIWMGAYVPQQFYATGWGETAYLLYKDVNRDVRFEGFAAAR
ncbi:(S)-ureidoglycine aminohydrolase [Roseomonas frigidaquae]|uniref:(S)-ureidoglycine aminohydrolase n=1 Tax=Falsiroseomonas frigidaquae TaxID=487318 RepID=A0ABX1F1G6_9PROT|nr:(S)-ureidoglycine aminohydrolase [Falsiroseomonas frigidaquae]NKE46193.1 (S)-ureidoglycine aminohydrolase [Falsiroseomonas frigidaquae]